MTTRQHFGLSSAERSVLAVAQLNAHASIDSIAKRMGASTHSVRRIVGRLLDKQIIFRRPLIDWSRLGIYRYYLYFSLPNLNQLRHDNAISFLVNSSSICYLHEMVGEHQYFACLLAHNPNQFKKIVTDLYSGIGNGFSSKQAGVLIRSLFWGRRYLAHGWEAQSPIQTGDLDEELFEADLIDRKIILLLGTDQYTTPFSIAKSLGLPANTISYRLKRLEARGVIPGYIFGTPQPLPGVASHRLLVSVTGEIKNTDKRLTTFCESERSITALNSMGASWDYEIVVEVEHASEFVELQRRLTYAFPELSTTYTYQTVRTLKPLSFEYLVSSSSAGEQAA